MPEHIPNQAKSVLLKMDLTVEFLKKYINKYKEHNNMELRQ